MIEVLKVIAPAVLAFIGAALGILVTRRNATELERRWRREETLRTLRWAADLAADTDTARSDLGVAALVALIDAELVRDEDKEYIRAILDAVLDPAATGSLETKDESEVQE